MTGRINKVHLLVGVSATAIALSVASAASAQDGIKMGAGTLNADVAVGYKYSDNVFAVENGTDADQALSFSPSVSWTSDNASGNNFKIGADAHFRRQDDLDQDDVNEYGATLDGNLNLNNGTELTYSAGYREAEEDRGTAVDFGSLEPVEFDETSGSLGLSKSGGRFEIETGVGIVVSDYEDGVREDPNNLGTFLIVNNDDRDNSVITIHGNISYNVANRSSVYVHAAYNDRDFDDREDITNLNRDSDGYSVGAGLSILLSDVSTVSFGGHYHDQNFDDSGFRDVDGFGGEATFVWLPTEQTTVSASINHEYADTSLQQISGSLTQSVALTVVHSLTDRVTLSTDMSASRAEYEGQGASAKANGDREDETMSAGIAVDFQANDNITMGASADFIDRDSNVGGDDYDRTTLKAHVTWRL